MSSEQAWLNTESVAIAEGADHRGSRRRHGLAKRLAKTIHAWCVAEGLEVEPPDSCVLLCCSSGSRSEPDNRVAHAVWTCTPQRVPWLTAVLV